MAIRLSESRHRFPRGGLAFGDERALATAGDSGTMRRLARRASLSSAPAGSARAAVASRAMARSSFEGDEGAPWVSSIVVFRVSRVHGQAPLATGSTGEVVFAAPVWTRAASICRLASDVTPGR